MARGAPASRLSHVSPDVCAGERCGRTFLRARARARVCVCVRACMRACTYSVRVRWRARALPRRITHIRTYTRARVCTRVFRAAYLLYGGDCIAARCLG